MSEPKPINRLEDVAGGLRVVASDRSNLWTWPDGRLNVLTREYEDLFTAVASRSEDGTGTLRIGSAAHIGDCEGWHIHGANGIYAEVSFEERDLTDAERAWCGDSPLYHSTETVVEFAMPHPEDLRSAIVDQDLQRFHCLDAVIEDHDQRHDVLTDLQGRIATEDVRSNQLRPRKGMAVDLLPEWDPENDHNDGKTREHLYDMAGMRKDAHLCDFESIVGFEYSAFRNARLRVLDLYEPNLEPYELCALDVAGYPEWTYCQECGAVGPGECFLDVALERRSGRRRVCDRCADRKAEYEDGFHEYTLENVAAARDRRAQQEGGQRNLSGEYSSESADR